MAKTWTDDYKKKPPLITKGDYKSAIVLLEVVQKNEKQYTHTHTHTVCNADSGILWRTSSREQAAGASVVVQSQVSHNHLFVSFPCKHTCLKMHCAI